MLIIDGCSGIGDSIHQRAILGGLMRGNDVWLRTSFPQLFHDVDRLRLVPLYQGNPERLGRTQVKNEKRSSQFYTKEPRAKVLNCRYSGEDVRNTGSIVGAMAKACRTQVGKSFALTLKLEWLAEAQRLIDGFKTTKPIMVYRPLTLRTDFPKKGEARNPDYQAYADLFHAIRRRYFVVSVADLEPDREWLVGEEIKADATFHAGELSVEVLAALIAKSALVFSPAGFAPILAQSVGTPSVAVFGGHESGKTISFGARLTPTLTIEPIHPCDCFDPDHGCDKTMDLPVAVGRLQQFVSDYA